MINNNLRALILKDWGLNKVNNVEQNKCNNNLENNGMNICLVLEEQLPEMGGVKLNIIPI